MNNPSIEELEQQLDFYGTGMQLYPVAMMNVIETEKALEQARQQSLMNEDLSDDESDDFSLSLTDKRHF